MFQVLSTFSPPQIIALTAVGGGLLCGLTAIVTGISHANKRLEIDAALKQDMLDRGMSAEDIRMVLDAGTPASLKAVGKHASYMD